MVRYFCTKCEVTGKDRGSIARKPACWHCGSSRHVRLI